MKDNSCVKNNTLQFYNENAVEYAKATVDVDMSDHRNHFLKELDAHPYILDLGCGSGRDTKAFLESGCRVDAIDGCEKLCQIAAIHTGIEIKCLKFHELAEHEKYDGIWACASLLHVPFADLGLILEKIKEALKDDGILYMSFKYGSEERISAEKHYTDMDESKLKLLIHDIKGMHMEDAWYSADQVPGRTGKWINVLVRKTKD